jgi:hypothetical protein
MEKEQIIPEDVLQDANRLYPNNGIATITTEAQKRGYIQGRIDERAKGKQWTDKEVNILISYLSKYSWGHYNPVASIIKWWEQYKQQIK